MVIIAITNLARAGPQVVHRLVTVKLVKQTLVKEVRQSTVDSILQVRLAIKDSAKVKRVEKVVLFS